VFPATERRAAGRAVREGLRGASGDGAGAGKAARTKRRGRLLGALSLVALGLVALARLVALSLTAASLVVVVVFVLAVVTDAQNRPPVD
jgi:hypothetical protein